MTRQKRKWDKQHLARNTASRADADADFSLMQCYPLPKASVLTQRGHTSTQSCPRMLIWGGYDLEKQIQIVDGFPLISVRAR